jgi:hypothetical protein
MRLRLLGALFLLTTVCAGCAVMRVKVEDKDWLEKRLVKRINSYQSSYLKNEPEKMWGLTLNSIPGKGGTDKENYIKLIKGSNHMATYYKVKYLIYGIEIREKKARVKMTYLVQEKEDSVVSEAGLHDFWIFENDDWFFVTGGKPELYLPKGWW